MTREEFIQRLMALGCFACGTSLDLEIHHWRTKGAGGDNDLTNLICLCANHHTQNEDSVHRLKPREFLKKYPRIRTYLETLGWHFEEVNGKFIQWREEICKA